MSRLLERDGYHVIATATSHEFSEWDELDLVIANLGSSKADGLELVRAVWAKQPDLKIIALSDPIYIDALRAEARPDILAIVRMPQRAQSVVGSIRDFLPAHPKSALSAAHRYQR